MASDRSPVAVDRNMFVSFWIVMAVMVVVALSPLAERYEARLFPVVDEFTVRETREDGDWVILSGDMRKRRDCAFLSLTFYAGDPDDMDRPRERLHVAFLDQPDGLDESRAPGRQPWGPWRIARPQNPAYPRVFMRVNHRCHPLWHTSGVYLNMPVAEVFAAQGAARPPASAAPDLWRDEAP